MLKLGKFWNVLGKVQGQKRPAAEVAREVEESMLKKAKDTLSGSVAELVARSELSAASSSACSGSQAAPSMPSASTGAEPATDMSLPEVLSRLQSHSLQACAQQLGQEEQQLLQDIPVLQEWQGTSRPSHNVHV